MGVQYTSSYYYYRTRLASMLTVHVSKALSMCPPADPTQLQRHGDETPPPYLLRHFLSYSRVLTYTYQTPCASGVIGSPTLKISRVSF